MNNQFTAIVYCQNEKKIATQTGNDIDKLYAWMLIQGNDHVGEIHGEILDNQSQKIIRTFRKTSIE